MNIVKYRLHLFISAIVVKLCISFLLLYSKGYPAVSLEEIACTGDCALSYVPATTNILEHGSFTIYRDLTPYAGRMPGYEAVLILSTLFSGTSDISFLFVILFQSILAGISMYFLATLSYSIFKSTRIFMLTFVLYGISTYTSLLDIAVLTESIAFSVFIIGFSLLFDRDHNQRYWSKFLIGSMLLYGVLLRQYILPFFALWIIYIVYLEYTRSKSFKSIMVSVTLFLLPLLTFETYWILRNYQQKKQFIPLVDSLYAGYDDPNAKGEPFYFPPRMKALANFVKSWGGDFIWWNSKAEITAFVSTPPKSPAEQHQMLDNFPSYIYTTKYNRDSLIHIQKFFQGEIQTEEQQVVRSLEMFEASFKEEKPGYYYVVAPTKLLFKFLFHSGTYNLFDSTFSDLSFIEKCIKIGYSILYGTVLIFGLSGVFMLLWSNFRSVENLILIATALYIILLVSFVLRRIEYRHFAFSYPYFVMLCSYFIVKTADYVKNKLNRRQIT